MSETAIPQSILDRKRVTVAEMAAALNYSVPHIRRLYREGKLPKPDTVGNGRKLGWPMATLVALTSPKKEAA